MAVSYVLVLPGIAFHLVGRLEAGIDLRNSQQLMVTLLVGDDRSVGSQKEVHIHGTVKM